MNFFKPSVLSEIKKGEIGVKVCKKVFDLKFLKELDLIRKNELDTQVNREDANKSSFNFDQHELFVELKKILHSELGDFYINDFSPHFNTSKFPLRIHADTGKDPEDVIGQNILIPIEIFPNNKIAHTIVFKNRWYGPGAFFTENESDGFDHLLKDINDKFIDIEDVRKLNQKTLKLKDGELFNYNEGTFLFNQNFNDNILKLINSKRYNIRTNKHITEGRPFDRKIYEQYLTHQPYDDLTDLEVKMIYKWEIGDIFVWDRSLIHSSDNYLANGVINKTLLPLFTSKIFRPKEKQKGHF